MGTLSVELDFDVMTPAERKEHPPREPKPRRKRW